jgi:hypothetical protein
MEAGDAVKITCGNCKHWRAPTDDDTYGHCGRIDTWRSGPNPVVRTDEDGEEYIRKDATAAATADSSGYHSCLKCRTDFACILHEAGQG